MRVTKYAKFEPLTVTWVDIVEDASWKSVEEIMQKLTCLVKQPGYFIANKHHKDKGTMLIMATSLSEDNEAGYVVIPWGCIRKVDTNGKCKN